MMDNAYRIAQGVVLMSVLWALVVLALAILSRKGAR